MNTELIILHFHVLIRLPVYPTTVKIQWRVSDSTNLGWWHLMLAMRSVHKKGEINRNFFNRQLVSLFEA